MITIARMMKLDESFDYLESGNASTLTNEEAVTEIVQWLQEDGGKEKLAALKSRIEEMFDAEFYEAVEKGLTDAK